jgi:hypothetical protein
MGDDRPPYHNQAGASGGIAGPLSAQSSAQRSSRRSPKTPLHIKNYNKIKGKMSTTKYNVAH